jgi:hypothetical protein
MSHAPPGHPIIHRAITVLLVGVVATWLAAPAGAQMREFTGRVSRVTASQLTVDNRMGDQLSFARSQNTRVRGAKEEWAAIESSDHVTVHWSFADKPRQAHRVVVLPAR